MHATSFSVSSPTRSCGAREKERTLGTRLVKSVPLLFDVLQRFDSPCLNCFNGQKRPIVNSFVFFPFYRNIRHYHKLINTTYRVNALVPKKDTCLLSTNKNWRAVLSTCGVAHWIHKHFLNPNVNLNSKAKNYIVLRWIKVLGNDLPSRVGWSWIGTAFFMKHDNDIHHTDIRHANWL